MNVTEMAYSHNSNPTGTNSRTHMATIDGFLNFTVNQIGKMNGRYLSRERWFMTVKRSALNRIAE